MTTNSTMLLDDTGMMYFEEPSGGSSSTTVFDENWVRQAFVLPDDGMTDKKDLQNRYWTSADAKFTDGRFGCNIGINCYPQYTPYADIPSKGRVRDREEVSALSSTSNYGLGGAWSMMHDDNAQIIYMRFGVPEFNSPFSFFTGAFNHGASVLARTGRTPLLYDVSKFIGSWIMFRALPLVTVPVLIFRTLDFFFFRQSARFYHMKATMHLYWGGVNTLLNALALNRGIYPKVMKQNEDPRQRIGMPMEIDQDNMDYYHELFPDVFDSQNAFDAFGIANRAQRLANKIIREEFDALNQGSNTSFLGYVDKEVTGDGRHSTRFSDKDGKISFSDYLNNFLSFEDFYKNNKEKPPTEGDPRDNTPEEKPNTLYGDSFLEKYGQHLDAEFRMGGQFAIFRVDHTGPSTSSFSNTSTPSDLENKFNSTSSSFQHARFTFGNGMFLGEIMETALGAVTDVAMGALSGVTFGLADAIKGLLGDGYVDIPEHWQSSSASLPTASYKMTLYSPYGNAISQVMNLFLPFAMLAAGSWCRSTGRQSYTAPFLCQLYDRGRVQIPLGMITEFSVASGTGNIGFSPQGAPLAMELSFRVKDFSRILHMPLMGVMENSNRTMIDEDSAITNYLAGLAGQSIQNQIYPSTRFKTRLAKVLLDWGVISSPAFWGSFVHDQWTSGLMSYLGVGKLLESAVRNTENTEGSVF